MNVSAFFFTVIENGAETFIKNVSAIFFLMCSKDSKERRNVSRFKKVFKYVRCFCDLVVFINIKMNLGPNGPLELTF